MCCLPRCRFHGSGVMMRPAPSPELRAFWAAKLQWELHGEPEFGPCYDQMMAASDVYIASFQASREGGEDA